MVYSIEDNSLKLERTIKECTPTYEIDTYVDQNGKEWLFSTSKDQPVHLTEVSTGKVHTQYLCRNHVEEIITPIALKVIPETQTLITGHNKGLLKIFKIQRPYEAPQTFSIKKSKTLQRIPFSALNYSPKDPNLLALGSFDSSVYLVDQKSLKLTHKLSGFTSRGIT